MLPRKSDLSRGNVDACYAETMLDQSLGAWHTGSTAQFEDAFAWSQEGKELLEILKAGGAGPWNVPGEVGGSDNVVAVFDE
jgi:hypothetical protein